MNRRSFLSIAAHTPLVVGPSLLVAPALVEASRAPDSLDLRRYYAFLWSEFRRLGEHMGCGMHSAHTIWGDPPVAGQIIAHVEATPPADRALRVLTAAGL